MAALPRGMFAATDVVLVPTLSENHCLAYVSWAKGFDPVSAPLFVVHLMFPSGVAPTGAPGGYRVVDPMQALFYRLAFDIADRPGGAPVYFFGGGRQIAREFSCLSGRTIQPHPVPIRPQRRRPLSREGRPVALLYAGDAKIEKGIHLLPELAARLCAAHPDWDFTAHVNNSTSWGEALHAYEALRQSSESLPNFRLYQGHLSADAYLDFLEEAHCLLCTYDPEIYARKSSGVIWECISLGIPMLVPADCWLEKEAEEWGAGCMSFRPYDLDGMCGHFDKFAALLGALEQNPPKRPGNTRASMVPRPSSTRSPLCRSRGSWQPVSVAARSSACCRWTRSTRPAGTAPRGSTSAAGALDGKGSATPHSVVVSGALDPGVVRR